MKVMIDHENDDRGGKKIGLVIAALSNIVNPLLAFLSLSKWFNSICIILCR